MPRKRNGIAPKRKRYVIKRRFTKHRMSKQLTSFPKTRKIVMKYQDSLDLVSSVLTPQPIYVWRANSIFDPDFTGIGHQPLGHDEWQKYYNKYVVLKSTITVRAQGNNATNTPYIIGVLLSESTAPVNVTAQGTNEQPNSVFDFGSATTNGYQPMIHKVYDARSWHNLKDTKDASQLTALMTDQPADEVYFIVYASNYDFINASTVIKCNIMLEYTVLLSDPVELVQS